MCMLWCMVHSCAWAQNKCVEFTFLDASSREAIPGLVVASKMDQMRFVSTDENGKACLVAMESDSMIILNSAYAGWAKAEFNVVYVVQRDVALQELVISAFRHGRTVQETPGSIGIIRSAQLTAYDQTSLQNAMNTIPGVAMESRGYGGSQRINIRGSFLRSPTAVRNVRMYLNGIPFSSPDGTAPLELMDAWDLSGIEVIKGPAGSLYGSGTGGVLLLNTKRAVADGFNAQHSQMHGAFSVDRYTTAVEWQRHRWNVRLSHIYQDNLGYRRQEFNQKQQVSLMAEYRHSDKLKYFFYSTYYTGRLGLPGALTLSIAETNPQQANAFSFANNTSLFRTRWFSALSQEYRFNDRWSNVTSVYGVTSDKENPYGTSLFNNGFKYEPSSEWGTRSEVKGRWSKGAVRFTSNMGVEIQAEDFRLTEYKLVNGAAGDWKFTQGARYLSTMAFAGTDASWKKWMFTAGASINRTTHRIDYSSALPVTFDSLATWKTGILPRIAALYNFSAEWTFHGSISAGNSNPTIFEQVDASYLDPRYSSYRRSLSPERGINYEVGVKGRKGEQLQWEASAYHFNLRDAIVQSWVLVNTPSVGTTEVLSYANAGSTSQNGVEVLVRYEKALKKGWGLNSLSVTSAAAFQHYVFGNYKVQEDSYNGNRLAGTPLFTWNNQVRALLLDEGVTINLQQFVVGKNYMDFDNEDYIKPYQIINLRVDVALEKYVYPFIPCQLFVGVNNLTNTFYSSFPNLNDFNERYYNPGPTRNFYVGLQVRLK